MRLSQLRPTFLSLFLLPAVLLAADASGFAQARSDLPADPAARFGVLPNGVRYVIYPNHEPRGRTSLRLLVLAGSRHEDDDQRGLAHFLEHMAFNGGAHFQPGTLVEYFQRLGMSFGGDTNASTNFERTLYLLELPDSSASTVSEGLRLFSDDVAGLLLLPHEVEKERGVVLSEKRARDTVALRTLHATNDFTLEGTRIPMRSPIGTPEIISHAPRERLAAFWDTWYRPERTVVIVVGEADPVATEKQIADTFASFKARAPARPDPSLGAVAKFPGIRTTFIAEPEAATTTLSIRCLTPAIGPDSVATRLQRLKERIAISILTQRLSSLSRQPDSTLISARATITPRYNLFTEAALELTCEPKQWAGAIAAAEQELRRLIQYGPTSSELKVAIQVQRTALREAINGEAGRRSGRIADAIAASIVNQEVFASAGDLDRLLSPELGKVGTNDVLEALRSTFYGNGQYVIVSGNADIPGDAAAKIATVYHESAEKTVEPRARPSSATVKRTNFGPPGTIESRTEVADLGVVMVTFANGVRLNLKRTDFEPGRLQLLVRVSGGALAEPSEQRGLRELAAAMATGGGFGRVDEPSGRDAPAGGTSFRVTQDAFEFSSPRQLAATRRTQPTGLPTALLRSQLERIAATILEPVCRADALRAARRSLEQRYAVLEHSASGPLETEVATLLVDGDPRFGLPPESVTMTRTVEEVRAWIGAEFSHAAVEVAIVGDFDLETTIAAVARTLGTLPRRDPPASLAIQHPIAFPKTPFRRSYTINTTLPKALVAVYWPTTDGLDPRRARKLMLLTNVLTDRLRVHIREDRGDTYSARARNYASTVFPGYGYISTMIDADPAQAISVAEAVVTTADTLAREGISEEELIRAREPMLTAMRDAQRTNGYWLSLLGHLQEHLELLDSARTQLVDVGTTTAAQLSALAKEYLRGSRASLVIVQPKAERPDRR